MDLLKGIFSFSNDKKAANDKYPAEIRDIITKLENIKIHCDDLIAANPGELNEIQINDSEFVENCEIIDAIIDSEINHINDTIDGRPLFIREDIKDIANNQLKGCKINLKAHKSVAEKNEAFKAPSGKLKTLLNKLTSPQFIAIINRKIKQTQDSNNNDTVELNGTR